MRKIKATALILGVLMLSLAFGYLTIAWTEPGVPPPEGNVSAPVNVGSDGQSKEGGLILNTGGAEYGLIVDKGNLYASENVWDDCGWTAYTCDASQTCSDGEFVAGVERYTTGDLCGSELEVWYQMRLYCCKI